MNIALQKIVCTTLGGVLQIGVVKNFAIFIRKAACYVKPGAEKIEQDEGHLPKGVKCNQPAMMYRFE